METAKLNVLVLEDHAGTRKLLAMEFQRRGHRVIEFADAATAIVALERKRFPLDVAVVDLINMGYGGNAGQWLRASADYRNVPIIYYSGLERRQIDQRIFADPATCYMHKDPGSISRVVDKAESFSRPAGGAGQEDA